MQSEDRQKLAEKYREYFMSAWEDKQKKGIPEKFALFDSYWEGDVNLPETETDPGSSTNIIHSNVEGQVAILSGQRIAVKPLPVTPDDRPFAETVRACLEFIKEKNKMTRKIDIHERRREKYGTGIFRVTYNCDALSGIGMPEIEPCNPLNVYVDPAITDVYKIDEAEFIIEVLNKSVYFAKEQYGEEVAEMIEPGYLPQYDDALSEILSGEDEYLHMLVWTKEEGKLRLVEMTGCGLILSDSLDTCNAYYSTRRYPYFFTPLYFREGSIWGKGDVELLIPVQDLINDLDDQIRINARLTGNPQRLIETGAGIDLDALTNEAGLNIPTNSVSAVKNLEAPSLPSYIIQRREAAVQYEGQRVTRFSDQMSGSKQQGVTTATESRALQQAGAYVVEQKKMMLQETLSEVFSYCLELVREFWTENVAIRLSDKADSFIFFNSEELKTGKDKKDAQFDVFVTVGAGLPTDKDAVYSMMSGLFNMGVVSIDEFRNYLSEYVGIPLKEGEINEHDISASQRGKEN